MLDRNDIKFFKLAVGLENLGKETDKDVSARCPVCGDSRTNKRTKRLHLYEKNGVTNVNCFNGDCAVHNKTMYSFIKEFFPALFEQFKKDNFKNTIQRLASNEDVFASFKKEEPKKEKPVLTQDLTPYLKNITLSEECIVYLRNRGIPYIADKRGKWYFGYQDIKIGDTIYKITDSIVIPLYYNDEMYGFYSRSIKDKSFCTYMHDANIGYKIWNWFNVDKSQPVYIFEGIFDAISSGKYNIIALMGAKIPEERLNELKYPVFVLDNDKTGLMNSLAYAKKGYSVYVQPDSFKEKDMNELMLNQRIDVSELIDTNTWKGLSAEVRIKSKL